MFATASLSWDYMSTNQERGDINSWHMQHSETMH